MSAETLINAALLADAPVQAVVAARIYPDFLGIEIVRPAIVNQRAETEYITTIHDGVPVGERVLMDTWCLADTRIEAEALADLVNAALPVDNFRIVNRRPEFEPDTFTYAAIVTSEVWP